MAAALMIAVYHRYIVNTAPALVACGSTAAQNTGMKRPTHKAPIPKTGIIIRPLETGFFLTRCHRRIDPITLPVAAPIATPLTAPTMANGASNRR
jgi:hypothetical protein